MLLITANTEPRTDIEPLIPQTHGMLSLDDSFKTRTPEGNGMPINKPRGKTRRKVMALLTVELWAKKYSRRLDRPKA